MLPFLWLLHFFFRSLVFLFFCYVFVLDKTSRNEFDTSIDIYVPPECSDRSLAHIIYSICSKCKDFNQTECRSISSITITDRTKEFLIDQNIRNFNKKFPQLFALAMRKYWFCSSNFANFFSLHRLALIFIRSPFPSANLRKQQSNQALSQPTDLVSGYIISFHIVGCGEKMGQTKMTRKSEKKMKPVSHGKQGNLFAKHIF